MKIFIYKSLIIFLLVFLAFHLTFNYAKRSIEREIYNFSSKENIEIIKDEIREKVKNSIEKEDLINNEDALLLRKFLKKLKKKFITKIRFELKKIIIVLPLFNDWKSASKLLTELNINFSNYKFIVEILIINDCSSEKSKNYFKKLANINKIEILSLKRNLGSQRAIYIGLKRIKKKTNSIIVVMDSDGEDDVSKVKNLVQKVQSNDDGIVFAKRTKRQEPFLLRFLNQIRLVLTFMFTGKYMEVGNFCAFDSKHLKSLLRNKNICIAVL